MKKIIVLFAVSILAFACKKSTEKKEDTSETVEIVTTENSHHPEISSDWNGSYFGTLTTADTKVKTFITLNSDSTYEKITERVGSDETPTIEEGTFGWSDDGCNIIFDNATKTSFKVGKASLSLLNNEGKEVLNNSELVKTANETLSENFKGFALQRFKSGKQEFNIFYNTNENKPTALITSDFFCEKLVQTTAWAKGAEYESGDYKLVTKNDAVSLFIKGKEIKLHQLKAVK